MVELHGLVHFVIRRLEEGQTLELGILKSLLVRMGGYDLADGVALSRHQLEGRAGSSNLKKETASFGVVDRSSRRAAKRLREILQERTMGLPLLTLISQIRQRVLLTTKSTSHIKLMGNLYDTCQVILDVLVDFLNMNEEVEVDGPSESITCYDTILPGLGDLVKDYGLDVEVAWMLARPVVRAAINPATIAAASLQQSMDETKVDEVTVTPNRFKRWNTGSDNMKKECLSFLPKETWDILSYRLFSSFWAHALYDLFFPRDLYEKEIERLRKDADRISQQHKRSGSNKVGAELDADRTRATATANALESDMKKQQMHCRAVRGSFEATKDELILHGGRGDAASALLAHCVLPRCLLAPQDALYCAKFTNLLHNTAVPNFCILQYLDTLLKMVAGIIFCVTEDEASNLGVLLHETWSIISGWRYDKKKFETNVINKPLSYEKFLDDMSQEKFKTLYSDWHELLGSTLIGALASTEYIHVRAALISLNMIVGVFPTKSDMGESLFEKLRSFQDDSRQDLKMMANAYVAQLQKARAAGVWKEEDGSKAKQRSLEEQAVMEEKIRNAKLKEEAMAKENATISRGLRDHSRGRHMGMGRDVGRTGPPHPNASVQPFVPVKAVFVPPNGGPARELIQDNRGDVRRDRSQSRDQNDRVLYDRQGTGQTNDSWSSRGESRDRRGVSDREARPRGDHDGTNSDSGRAGRSQISQSSSGGRGVPAPGVASDDGRWQRSGSSRGRGSESVPGLKRPASDGGQGDSRSNPSVERETPQSKRTRHGPDPPSSTYNSSSRAIPPAPASRGLESGGRDHDRDHDRDRDRNRGDDRGRYRGTTGRR